jgi:hypothetical protein
MGTVEPVAMTYFSKASSDFASKIPLIANENAFLGDIATSSVLSFVSTLSFNLLLQPKPSQNQA